MNILLVNHYAGSPSLGMEFRPYYMAREWQKAGHKVLIVCASNAHVRNKQFEFKENHTSQEIEGVNYFIIKTPAYTGNGLDRIKNMRAFIRGLYKNQKYFIESFKPDVVIASSTYPLDNYPCKKIAKKSNAKLIYEVHDLWPLSPMELGGYSKWHPFIYIMQKAENYAYKNCDSVISMLPTALEHMQEHGLSPEKFNYVPNGIVIEEWNNTLEIPESFSTQIAEQKAKGHILVGYAGSHGVANALDSIIKAMQILKDRKVSLFLIGDGPLKQDLVSLSKNLKLENVFFLPSVNKNLIPAILDKLDILYLGLQNQSLFRFGISPNKLIDYLMAGKPIIQAINAGNNIVKEADCGIWAEPENPNDAADAIIKLSEMSDSERKTLGNNGHAYCLQNHDYKILAKKFVEICSR